MQPPHLFSIVAFVGMVFLPAAALLFFAWSVWSSNKRPQTAEWRIAAFKFGLACVPVSMALLAPGGAHYLKAWGPPNLVFTIANWLGLLLWAFGVVAALIGTGRARWLLFSSGVLEMLGVLVIYLTYP
jgi:hypothetical protein